MRDGGPRFYRDEGRMLSHPESGLAKSMCVLKFTVIKSHVGDVAHAHQTLTRVEGAKVTEGQARRSKVTGALAWSLKDFLVLCCVVFCLFQSNGRKTGPEVFPKLKWLEGSELPAPTLLSVLEAPQEEAHRKGDPPATFH